MIIRNIDEFSERGSIKGRRLVLDVADQTLTQMNYKSIIGKLVTLKKGILNVKDLDFDLRKFHNIYLVGAGKNVAFMTHGLEEILGERIREGIAIEKKGSRAEAATIPIVKAGHPIPDEDSVKGANEIIRIARQAHRDDLLIVCVSGGWTSLVGAPPEEISLEEFREVYDLLLRSGMPLEEMNIIRNHLSRLGEGKIPIVAKDTTILGLIAVDEIGGRPWGPTVPGNTYFSDALRVLTQWNLISAIPAKVREYIEAAKLHEETTNFRANKSDNSRVHNVVIADNVSMCEMACQNAARTGINSQILTTTLQGESKHVGTVIASICNEVSQYHRPFRPPCILIAGGETTVTLTGKVGKGGRNQEMALSAALSLNEGKETVILAMGTDGTDGPTDIAGAIVDNTTVKRALDTGIDITEELKSHNSSHVFSKINDAVYTYDTGTNLMDIIIMYIPDK